MRLLFKSLGVLVAAAMAAGAIAVALGARAWTRQTDAALQRLAAATAEPAPATFSPTELDGLPAPVVRYFEYALTAGQPMVRSARIEHEGEFRTAIDAGWSPFRSVQHFSVQRPGFVWDAKIRMAPGLTVRVRDSYVDGEAGMRGMLAGVLTVVDEAGTPSLNSGALHRYFMERAWLPTAMLPSQGVRWEPRDDHSARAFFRDAGPELAIDVFFDAEGAIVRVEAERMRDVDGVGVLTPFTGRFRDYRRVDGMMVPMQGEVEWQLPEGTLDFWRGRISAIDYVFAQ